VTGAPPLLTHLLGTRHQSAAVMSAAFSAPVMYLLGGAYCRRGSVVQAVVLMARFRRWCAVQVSFSTQSSLAVLPLALGHSGKPSGC
jgi:hypothetical protein